MKNSNLSTSFCVLKYQSQGAESGHLSDSSILVILLYTKSKTLRLLVAPVWRAIVDSRDVEYIDNLLNDFSLRARTDPEALFQQLSSLSVGPLVTYSTGVNLADHPELEALSNTFTEI